MILATRRHAVAAGVTVMATLLLLGACGDDNGDEASSEPLVRLMIPGGFTADGPGSPGIVELPSGNKHSIDTDAVMTGVAWAPGGEHLLVNALDLEGDEVRYLILDHEGEPVAEYPFVLDIQLPMLRPSWSPDGEVVAFSGEEIVLMDVEGNVVTTADLPEHGNSSMMSSWSPDGQRVVVPVLSELLVIGRDGSEQRIPLPTASAEDTARFDFAEWDGDVVSIHGQFPGDDAEELPVLRAIEVDLGSEAVVDEYEETFDERAAVFTQLYGFSEERSQKLDEAIAELAPEGLISVISGPINHAEGRWEAFADSRQAPSAATIVVAWEDIAAKYELSEGEFTSRLRTVIAVGVPGSE